MDRGFLIAMLPTFVLLVFFFSLLFVLFPIIFVGTEMFTTVVLSVTTIHGVLFITVVAYAFKLVLTEARRQITVAYDYPWSLAVTRHVPAPVAEEVISILCEKKVVGETYRHEKTEWPREDELGIFCNAKVHWWLVSRFMDDDLLGAVA